MSNEIPNNVDLDSDQQLRRALAVWHPHYLDWWREVGPDGFDASHVYLRTAISVSAEGWANYGYVRMQDYRWGIFLAPKWRIAGSVSSAIITASRSGSRCPASSARSCAGSS